MKWEGMLRGNMNTIPNKCYIVANLPGEISDWVTSLRKKMDPALAHMPVEVTLSGSSGIGPLVEGQSFDKVKCVLKEILSNIAPFEFRFRGMNKFPSVDIYFLEPEPDVFCLIHKKLVDSELEFEKHRFPYGAHCTVSWI